MDHRWRRARRAFAQTLAHTLRSQAGQDLIEYGLLAGLIAVVAIGAVRLLGARWATGGAPSGSASLTCGERPGRRRTHGARPVGVTQEGGEDIG